MMGPLLWSMGESLLGWSMGTSDKMGDKRVSPLCAALINLAQRKAWLGLLKAPGGRRGPSALGVLAWRDDHPAFESGRETICKHVLMRSRRKPGTKSSPCSLHADSSREPI